jgi:hypothetical protein
MPNSRGCCNNLPQGPRKLKETIGQEIIVEMNMISIYGKVLKTRWYLHYFLN